MVEANPSVGARVTAFGRSPWALAAAAVAILGIGLRVLPVGLWAVWGSDTGEYVFLTERLLSTGRVSFDYDGWGLAYPYFPGLFILSGTVAAMTGVSAFTGVQWTVPALAGLIGLGVLLVTHRATGSPLAAVVAGGLVAATAPSVIVTSHAMPASLGHVFVLAGFVAVFGARHDRRYLLVLALALLALVLTHHLSTYFFAGILAGAAFFRELGSRVSDRAALRIEVPVVAVTVALAAAWWLGVAERFRERIVGDVVALPPFVTVALFLAALAVLPGIVALRRALVPAGAWRTRAPSPRRIAVLAVAVPVGLFVLVASFAVTGVPGSAIRIGSVTLVYLVAVLPLVALVGVGFAPARFTRDGFFLVGWLGAILASLTFAAVTRSPVLFPFRHVDYMIEAMAAIAGVGFVVLYRYAKSGVSKRWTPRVAGTALVLVIVVAALTSYPPREAIGGFEERMTHAELTGVYWVRDNLPPGSTIAADHRLSSLLFGFAGMRATWDETPRTFHAEAWPDVAAELAALDIASGDGQRIDYVFLSPETRAGVTLNQWENSRPMTDAAYAKFFDDTDHFETVYSADDVHVFRVRWENA